MDGMYVHIDGVLSDFTSSDGVSSAIRARDHQPRLAVAGTHQDNTISINVTYDIHLYMI
jgi:hypothetical protein